jgi:transposase
MWTWCFRASLYTLFKIDPTRSGDVLVQVLGREFDGVLGCDCLYAFTRNWPSPKSSNTEVEP